MKTRKPVLRPAHTLPGLLLAALLAALPAGAAVAAAGSFLFVAGDVNVTPATGGSPVRVRRGAEVEPGDTIRTGLRGIAQLRMVDGALLAVRPGTELRIDDYSFEEPEKEDRSFFSLVSGAFRSITGLIGQRNIDGYRVSTTTATIGIRGSDADIGHDPNTQLTAVRTYEGGHTVTASGQSGPQATLLTGPGDIALVRPGEFPSFGTSFPFSTTPPPDDAGAGEEDGDADQDGEGDAGTAEGEDEEAEAVVAGADGEESEVTASLAPPPPPVVQLVTADQQQSLLQLETLRIAPVGSFVVGADMFIDTSGLVGGSGSSVIDGDGNEFAILGPSNELLLAVDTNVNEDPFLFSADGGTLAIIDTGRVTDLDGNVAATVSWGLWQGGFTIIDSGVVRDQNIGGFAFGVGSRVTRPLEIAALGGTAFSYSQFGFAFTNESGALASFVNVQASGQFLASTTLGNISISASASFPSGSTGWSLSGSGSVRDLIQDGPGVSLFGSCSSCSSASGEAHGQFLGQRAEGLVLGVGAADSSTSQAVAGVAAMQRSP